ncbi:ankyrin repeat domain-containing protein [Rossellomorea sp. BNER]
MIGENQDISLFLIENGFDVNLSDYDGNTPLHLMQNILI